MTELIKSAAVITLKLYTDFICPFCYIAETSTYLRLQQEFAVTVDWRGFELHPDTPVGGMALAELFPGRDVGQMHAYVIQFAKTFGVVLPKPSGHLPNTRAALAAAEYAREHGKLDAFRRAAQLAYWQEGHDLEAPATFRAAARKAGLDPAAVVSASVDPVYLSRVDAMRAESEALGVSGVPTMVFPGGESVVGCQPYETLAAAARRAGANPRAR